MGSFINHKLPLNGEYHDDLLMCGVGKNSEYTENHDKSNWFAQLLVNWLLSVLSVYIARVNELRGKKSDSPDHHRETTLKFTFIKMSKIHFRRYLPRMMKYR